MWRLTLGTLALLALSGTASAADLRRPAPPRPPSVFSWTGCYFGGYVGGAWTQDDPTFTDLGNSTFRSYSGGIVPGRLEASHSWTNGLDSSFIGGGTVGCNLQPVGTSFMIGFEGETGYMKLEGSAFDPLRSPTLAAVSPDVLGSTKVGDWYGMVTGRLGYAWGTALLYIKGGVAFVSVQASVLDQCTTVAAGCGNWLTSSSDSKTVTTGTLGGGIEWAFAGNWSIKGEYMFIGLGDLHTETSCNTATLASGAVVGGGPFCFSHELQGIHSAKVGLNYRFGPVTAY